MKLSKVGLLSDLNRAGVNTSLVCFEIGSRGLITQDNVARIRSILNFKGVSFKKQIGRDISKLALLGSYARSGTVERKPSGTTLAALK